MLLQKFETNEVVHILDPTTFIWELAKITAFTSDWSVRIKWMEWSTRKAVDITVPEIDREDEVDITFQNFFSKYFTKLSDVLGLSSDVMRNQLREQKYIIPIDVTLRSYVGVNKLETGSSRHSAKIG